MDVSLVICCQRLCYKRSDVFGCFAHKLWLFEILWKDLRAYWTANLCLFQTPLALIFTILKWIIYGVESKDYFDGLTAMLVMLVNGFVGKCLQ